MEQLLEEISNSKEKLHALEQSEQYLFHGSSSGNIETLEPRQAKHFPSKQKPKELILDGSPAVSATPYSEIAIFRAITSDENIPFSHTTGFSASNGNLEFRVSSEKVLEAIKDKGGYVYVFDRKDFEPYSRDGEATEKSMEWRAYKEVKPVEIIKVHSGDLPEREGIEITGE